MRKYLLLIITSLLFQYTLESNTYARTIKKNQEHKTRRLINLLHKAQITSPLLQVSPIESLNSAQGQIKKKKILAEEFDNTPYKKLGWKKYGSCRVAGKPRASLSEKAFEYVGDNPSECIFLIPAESSSYYEISRSIYTSTANIDYRVIESRLPLRHREILNHPEDIKRQIKGGFAIVKNLLQLHRFKQIKVEDKWVEDTMHLFTTPYTKTIIMIIEDANKNISDGSEEVWFDSIAIQQLLPKKTQELSLLKTSLLAENADTNLGMAKHGQLLPIGKADKVVEPYDSNFDYRYGIFAPAPTSITYELPIEANQRLRFSYALSKFSSIPDNATFSITITPLSGLKMPQKVFEKTIDLTNNKSQWRWYNEYIPLTNFANKTVSIRFQTESANNADGYAIWGNPIIETMNNNTHPNVILIAVDTLRADRLSAYGYSRNTSPHIDNLAHDGILFKNAISPGNWTTPSFASLFTGLMPSQHQVIHRARAISNDITTMAEYFQNAGFITQAFAYKAYLYNMNFEQGFDRWFNVPIINIQGHMNSKKAISWLGQHKHSQFFLFLHYNDPHQPFNQPQKYQDIFTRKNMAKTLGVTLPVTIGPKGKIAICKQCRNVNPPQKEFKTFAHGLYDGEVAYVDHNIGAVLDYLKQNNLYDNSIIAFVADHGEILWEHNNYFGHGGPYVYDELIHVPVIIKPAKNSSTAINRVITSQVRLHDVMPTLLDMVDITYDKQGIDAKSLIPHLQTTTHELKDRLAISENIKQRILSVRTNKWKYILSYPKGRRASEKLFNLSNDTSEQHNVNTAKPKILNKLRQVSMAYFLQNRTGRYLLITGVESAKKYSIQLTSDKPIKNVSVLYGLPVTKRTSQTITFSGRTTDKTVVFARLSRSLKSKLQVKVQSQGKTLYTKELNQSAHESRPYTKGILKEILSSTTISVSLLRGPKSEKTYTIQTIIDPDQVSALKALGYIE